ncbi:MAG TPA: DUF4369 domain-containing protein [Flavobacteriaceae bacterium]|nr:DUF4369 domain-containing protein [Flavobacteriaceae bacterium]
MRYFAIVLLALACACSKSENFTLEGHVKGLKKGTIYLQKIADSTFVTLDSTVVGGDSNFILNCHLEEPEVLFVKLDKNSQEDVTIRFFASEGVTTLNTTLKNFAYDAEITGSEQQKLFKEYSTMISKFNNKNLELIEQNLQAKMKNDSITADSIALAFERYYKSRYKYCLNFAATHGESEVAPYIALADMPDATTKVLDTIYKSLASDIKTSKYGKILKEEIDERKSQE